MKPQLSLLVCVAQVRTQLCPHSHLQARPRSSHYCAMLLLDPSAVAWDVFVDTWSGDYLERSFAISKRRADGSPLFRDLEERQIVEQERRAAVRARLETATKGKELKACCVEFGLPASGGKSVLAARLRAFADGGAPPKKRGRPLASANGAPASKRRRS